MKERRPRTPDENLAVEQMRCVGYPVASWDKRFMRSLSSVETITEKEAAQLWRLFIRYRKQMNFPAQGNLLQMAEGLAAPDFRKMEKVRKQEAEIEALKQKYAEAMEAK